MIALDDLENFHFSQTSFTMIIPLALLIFWTKLATGCMQYTATFPFADNLPFEATIKDDEVMTCWLSISYREHNLLTAHYYSKYSYLSHTVSRRLISTLDSEWKPKPDNENNGETEEVNADDETWEFREWEFYCLEGYAAQANVGLRSVQYKAHGETFWFMPDVVESVGEERWDYSLSSWCKKDEGVKAQDELR
jgi:hypothetical protein